jgi:hypothetical protein
LKEFLDESLRMMKDFQSKKNPIQTSYVTANPNDAEYNYLNMKDKVNEMK